MRAHERFLEYIKYETASDANNPACPSTEGQRVFGEALARELTSLGVHNAYIDENGYVYGSIWANCEGQRTIGLIAHMDTVSDVPCVPINARVIEDYDGNDIVLENGLVIRTEEFEALKKYKGQDLIVTDGNTLLGADDKAGIAEIMTLCETLLKDESIPHGRIEICFTPDEEIGRGADLFNLEKFSADYAYTVDGGEVGGINFENFNAASADVTIRGVNIHPGAAKGKMKNAALIATEFASLLPGAETPEHTERYEGFYHLRAISGAEEEAHLSYLLRDHDAKALESRKKIILKAAELMNLRHGEGVVSIDIRDSYQNMAEVLKSQMWIVDRAASAFSENGVTPAIEPIRGGTDGARLSFMGLACPNLSTGGMNAHGRRELVSVQSMDKMVKVLISLVRASTHRVLGNL